MIVGYVVHYEGERDGGAYTPNNAQPDWHNILTAMMKYRPDATVCVEPVNTVPEWVEQ